MDSTLKSRDSDPHDIFVIAPEVVPAAWADKVLADITNDADSDPRKAAAATVERQAARTAVAAAPTVDTTFRATATDDIPAPVAPPSTGHWTKSAIMFVFAVCSTAAAVAWQNHGDMAQQMVSNWIPTFAFASSAPAEQTAQADAPAVQAPAAEQTSPQPAAPAPSQATAAPPAVPSPEAAQLQVMARDIAAMAQQVEQLKASLAELKANPPPPTRETAKPSEVKAEPKTVVQTPRPRASPPPRSTAALPQRPLPPYPPTQVAAPAPLPQPVAPPAATPPATPPPQTATRTEDGEPVVRPPMPLRWGQDFR